MTGGIHWAGPRRGAEDEGMAAAPAGPEIAAAQPADEPPAPEGWRRRLVPALIAAALAAWAGLFLWVGLIQLEAGFDPVTLVKGVALACGPLGLLAVLFLLYQRNDKANARHFSDVARALRIESMGLTTALGLVSRRLEEERTELGRQVEALLAAGDSASQQVAGVNEALSRDTAALSRQTRLLDNAAASARVDMGVLLADLPDAEKRALALASALSAAGASARETGGLIERQVKALAEATGEAEGATTAAADRLGQALARVGEAGAEQARIIEAGHGAIAESIDSAVARAADAVERTRDNVAAQGAAMLSMIEQADAALAGTGQEAARALGVRIDALSAQLSRFAERLAAQVEASGAAIAALDNRFASAEARLAELDETGTARTRRLAEQLGGLSGHAERMTGALQDGGAAAQTLIQRAEALKGAVSACLTELNEKLPLALAELEEQAAHSHTAAKAAAPEVAALQKAAEAAAAQLRDAEQSVAGHRDQLAALTAQIEARIEAARGHADALTESINRADADARRFAEGAGAQLLDAMVRVRESAQTAAERARAALAGAVPASAEALAQAAEKAIGEVVAGQVETQARRIAEVSARAAESAEAAAERLRVQADAIARAASTLEGRIEEARQTQEASTEESLARRQALLVESLNSTAIDVTKLLSNEVTDTAWAAYLKGDKGVFTRRAVRLIEAGEAREIARHYEEEPDFREQVNRYIHDFEALLRPILAQRDGTTLGVALLSSDLGKLYVALAQAIERLRT